MNTRVINQSEGVWSVTPVASQNDWLARGKVSFSAFSEFWQGQL
jgi:hypothetical protein